MIVAAVRPLTLHEINIALVIQESGKLPENLSIESEDREGMPAFHYYPGEGILAVVNSRLCSSHDS